MGQCLSCIIGSQSGGEGHEGSPASFSNAIGSKNASSSNWYTLPDPKAKAISDEIDKKLQQIDDQRRDIKEILLLGKQDNAP
jgi:hypothetical protein